MPVSPENETHPVVPAHRVARHRQSVSGHPFKATAQPIDSYPETITAVGFVALMRSATQPSPQR